MKWNLGPCLCEKRRVMMISGGGGGGGKSSWSSSTSSWVPTTSVSASGKRIQREMVELNNDPPPDCSAGPKGDNLYHWIATIIGTPGIPYLLLLLSCFQHLIIITTVDFFFACRNTLPRWHLFPWHQISNWLSLQASRGTFFISFSHIVTYFGPCHVLHLGHSTIQYIWLAPSAYYLVLQRGWTSLSDCYVPHSV